jgi:ferritin-like metal-binding protein YciE
MANHGENLLEWLRDAHAMERQAERMLRAQSERIVHYPKVKARLEQHLRETCGQQRLLAGCIDRLGGKSSGFKDAVGKVMAFGQGARGALHPDEVVKAAISSYAFGNLQIATYTSLIAAAKTVADLETLRVCEQILGEKKTMAAWMLQHLSELTEEFLLRDSAGLEAKG